MEAAAAIMCGAVDDLLTVDVNTLSDADPHELVLSVQRQRARLGVVAAVALSRWDRRRVWEADQSVTAAARLARDTSTSLVSARVELRRARNSRTMPLTVAAIAAGTLSLDHLDLLARANQSDRRRQFANDEELLVTTCAGQRFKQASEFVEYWTQRVDAAGAERHAKYQQDGSRSMRHRRWVAWLFSPASLIRSAVRSS